MRHPQLLSVNTQPSNSICCRLLNSVLFCVCLLNEACHSFLQTKRAYHYTRITHLSSVASLLTKRPNLTDDASNNNGNISCNTSSELDERQLILRFGYPYAQKIQELVEYKSKHGDCMVPKRYKENPSLGNWVNK